MPKKTTRKKRPLKLLKRKKPILRSSVRGKIRSIARATKPARNVIKRTVKKAQSIASRAKDVARVVDATANRAFLGSKVGVTLYGWHALHNDKLPKANKRLDIAKSKLRRK